MSKNFFLVLFLVLFLFLFSSPIFAQEPKTETFEAVVTDVLEEKEIEKDQVYQKLEVLATSGSLKDKKIIIEVGKIAVVGQPEYQKDDRILVTRDFDLEGKEFFYISDFIRKSPLVWLFFVFVVLVVLIGRWRGVSSLLGLGFSFLVIFAFILPKIYEGKDPVFVAIAGALLIIPVSFYLSHGFNQKTTAAMVGTFIALVITGFLARVFVEATKLTGYASEEAAFLQVARPGTVNIKGLLLAGIIIGALGILDDITVSQAAIIQQLREANPKIKSKELFWRAMKVGQDHIASMVNTLVLVYTGASLSLLLLFINSPRPFSEIINYEIIAEEIVRALIGSIGLIAAVPITTFLATTFMPKKN